MKHQLADPWYQVATSIIFSTRCYGKWIEIEIDASDHEFWIWILKGPLQLLWSRCLLTRSCPFTWLPFTQECINYDRPKIYLSPVWGSYVLPRRFPQPWPTLFTTDYSFPTELKPHKVQVKLLLWPRWEVWKYSLLPSHPRCFRPCLLRPRPAKV